jgi:formylglycine-generating enzyme required for sulfatase activity
VILKPHFLKTLLFLMLLAAPLLLAGIATPQQNKPITKEQLINALRQLRPGDSQIGIVNQVKSRGVDFQLTSIILAELRIAGARDSLIAAVQNGFRPQPSPVPTVTPRHLVGRSPPAPLAWKVIEGRKNPQDFYDYLQKYPESENADKARDRLKELSNIRVQAELELVWIPPGSFMMGSENGEPDEKPVHRVTISKGFYLGKYEVTQAQWRKLMGDEPSHFKGDDLPVEQVSWGRVVGFIAKLNAQNDGYTYMLPSEAQWEYAARAGTVGDYAGDLDAMAWYDHNSEHHTHPVGRKQPNAFGLFDMHGNVFEWCEDGYHETYVGAPTDGSAWLSGVEKHRVLRGGTWGNNASFCRSADRVKVDPLLHHDDGVGLRILVIVRQ